MPKRQITNLDVSYYAMPHGNWFAVAVHRTEPGRRVRFYNHASRASLLRVNRAQRLLIRRVVDGYVEPAQQESFFDAVRADVDLTPERRAKWLALEPETTELAQIITTEFEAVNAEHTHMSHLAEQDADAMLRREA